jgi:hypothetical protein
MPTFKPRKADTCESTGGNLFLEHFVFNMNGTLLARFLSLSDAVAFAQQCRGRTLRHLARPNANIPTSSFEVAFSSLYPDYRPPLGDPGGRPDYAPVD